MNQTITNPIDTILQAEAREKAQHIREETDRINVTVKETGDQLLSEFQDYIGADLWEFFHPFAKIEYKIEPHHGSFNKSHVYVSIDIPALEKYQLAPIGVTWSVTSKNPSYRGSFMVWGGTSLRGIAETLQLARERYPVMVKKAHDKIIDEIKGQLNYYYGTKEEETAILLHKKLIELDPDHTADWDQRFADWRKMREAEIEREERNRIAEIEREQATLTYNQTLETLKGYFRSYYETLDTNIATAKSIQEMHDQPFTLGLLEYGVCALDEESGTHYVDTRNVHTFGEADGHGFYETGAGLVRYNFPVSFQWVQVKPTQDILSHKVRRHGVTLYFAPSISDIKIESLLSDLKEYPTFPEIPNTVASYHVKREADNAVRKERGQDELYDEYAF